MAGTARLHSDIISEQERELQDPKTRGYKKLTVRQKFERAGMIKEYLYFYNFLCTESPSNKRALIDRHANIFDNHFESPVRGKVNDLRQELDLIRSRNKASPSVQPDEREEMAGSARPTF
ncbi:MAG: hypothetical protein ACOZF2_16115 [Thermodesulfobacteriota bacterium]